MNSYVLKNGYNKILRIIIEPEAIEYDIEPNQQVTVVLSGNHPAFQCNHYVDKEGINCVSFWPEDGTVEIRINGDNIIDLL